MIDFSLCLAAMLRLSSLALLAGGTDRPGDLFLHTDCFDLYGNPTGSQINSTHRAALVEGFDLKDEGRLTGGNRMMTPVLRSHRSESDLFPIPDECFPPGEDALGRGNKHYDLVPCSTNRTPVEMLRICLTVCSKVEGCIAVEYDEYYTLKHHCHLHGKYDDPRLMSESSLGTKWPKCAFAPSRFQCSVRSEDNWVGIWCPSEPLPRHKLLPRQEVNPEHPLPFLEPSGVSYNIGLYFKLEYNVSDTARHLDCTCVTKAPSHKFEYCQDVDPPTVNTQGNLSRVLSDYFGLQENGARVECPENQMPAPRLHFIVWLVVPSADYDRVLGIVNDAACEENACAENHFRTEVAVRLAAAMSLDDTLRFVSSGRPQPLTERARDAVFDEGDDLRYMKCVKPDGSLGGVGISPNHRAMIFNRVQNNPEQHAGVIPVLRSMLREDDWYPVPEGCFEDMEVDGTKSNPALRRAGNQYRLLGEACVGNRTQQEMLLICLTICTYVDFGEEDYLEGDKEQESVDRRCFAANYDEHAYQGHCHLSEQSRTSITGRASAACEALNHGKDPAYPWMEENKTYQMPMCTKYKITGRPWCAEAGLPGSGTASCGVNDTLGIFCHHSPLVCVEVGKHVAGVELDCSTWGPVCDNKTTGIVSNFREFGMQAWTTFIPWTVYPTSPLDPQPESLMSEHFDHHLLEGSEDESVRGAVMGATDAACVLCPAGSYSVRVQSNYLHKSLIPRPRDQPGTVNVCISCPRGRKCRQGRGCDWNHDPSTCPEKCPIGHYSEGNVSACTTCPRNEYQDEEGWDKCKPCPGDLVTFGSGADAVEKCVCPLDKRRTSALSSSCVACVQGQDCAWTAGTYFNPITLVVESWAQEVNEKTAFQTQPYTMPGYWTEPSNPSQIFLCAPKRNHPDCLGGLPTNVDTLCKSPRSGRVCSECPEGDHALSDGGCETCDGVEGVRVAIFLLGIFVCLFVAYRVSTRTTKADSDILGEGGEAMSSDLLLMAGCLLGNLFQTFQFLGILGNLSVRWPRNLQNLFDFAGYINFDLSPFRLSCLADRSAISTYGLTIFFVFVVILFLPCLYLCSTFTESRRMQGPHVVHVIGTTLNLLFITFMAVAITPLICHPQVQEGSFLQSFPHITCWGGEHGGLIGISVLMLLLLGFYLAMVTWATQKLPSMSLQSGPDRREFLVATTFIYQRFKLDTWHYGGVLLFRNFVLSLVPIFATNEPGIQVALVNMIMVLGIAGQCYFWPWNVPLVNTMDLISSICCASVSALAAPFVSGTTNPDMYFQLAQFLITLTACMLVAASLSSTLMLTNWFSNLAGKNGRKYIILFHFFRMPPDKQHISEVVDLIGKRLALVSTERMGRVFNRMEFYDKMAVQWGLKFFNSEFGYNQDLNMNKISRIHTGLFFNSTSNQNSALSEESVPLGNAMELPDETDAQLGGGVLDAKASAAAAAPDPAEPTGSQNALRAEASLDKVAIELSPDPFEEDFGSIEDERGQVDPSQVERLTEALFAAQARLAEHERELQALRTEKVTGQIAPPM